MSAGTYYSIFTDGAAGDGASAVEIPFDVKLIQAGLTLILGTVMGAVLLCCIHSMRCFI